MTLEGGTGNEYRYHTARFDRETGLYFMRARYYSPTLGRFMQRDPIGVWTDEVNLGNAHGIVGSNAINRVDPFGLDVRISIPSAAYKAQLQQMVDELARAAGLPLKLRPCGGSGTTFRLDFDSTLGTRSRKST